MKIESAEFVTSSTDWFKCPLPQNPEFAFIGRSNVGKSSLINLLVGRKNLAKTSSTPGKTQTINHFLINRSWNLVDLPGYGYAAVSRSSRQAWGKMIEQYLMKRENLYCTFVLLDSRVPPQKSDFDFITWMGEQSLPIAVILTKSDKLKQHELAISKKTIEGKLLEQWETLPPLFVTSAEKKTGRKELLEFISNSLTENR
ncbi:MAG TPA: ribosome biogenesis GTP-binding protein YihA/YsxC [Cyclobacteriaceae bacterium]|jgi:GTP-binding protein|nr:ribosome biogenesis GTP-binding protein YihA/YsxC [Cyclobacteriaceae bacterium]